MFVDVGDDLDFEPLWKREVLAVLESSPNSSGVQIEPGDTVRYFDPDNYEYDTPNANHEFWRTGQVIKIERIYTALDGIGGIDDVVTIRSYNGKTRQHLLYAVELAS